MKTPREAPSTGSQAIRMLESLYRNYGTWHDPEEEGLILDGAGNLPQGQNIGVPLICGHYLNYVEGLARLRNKGPFYGE